MSHDFSVTLTAVVFVSSIVLLFHRIVATAMRKANAPLPRPIIVSISAFLLPAAGLLLILRGFVLDHFYVSSESMLPTLEVGDYVVVDKAAYGLRLPVLNRVLLSGGTPERGDVVVFIRPDEDATPYIKRIVGLPGDTVSYKNKTLSINDREWKKIPVTNNLSLNEAKHIFDVFNEVSHQIAEDPRINAKDGRWTVPDNTYFVLGDNRDNSEDSRIWGVVPDRNLLGKARCIWLSLAEGQQLNWGRIGQAI